MPDDKKEMKKESREITSFTAKRDDSDRYAYHVKIVNNKGEESTATVLTMGKCVNCF